jgi:hypothetical protein
MNNYDLVLGKFNQLLMKETEAIRTITDALDSKNLHISNDDEIFAILGLIELSKGYASYRAKLKDQFFPPNYLYNNKYLETIQYLDQIGSLANHAKRHSLNPKLIRTIHGITVTSFPLPPIWLARTCPDQGKKLFENWAHRLDRFHREGRLNEDDVREYFADFVDEFVKNSALGNDSSFSGSIMTCLLSISGENLFLPLLLQSFLQSDDSYREKLVLLFLSMRSSERHEETITLLGSWFDHSLSDREIPASAVLGRLVDICRLRMQFDTPESIEAARKAIENQSKMGISLSDVVNCIANCILETLESEEDSLFETGVKLSFVKNHVNLTFKAEIAGEAARYIKIGPSEWIEKELIGNQVLAQMLATLEDEGQKNASKSDPSVVRTLSGSSLSMPQKQECEHPGFTGSQREEFLADIQGER